MQLLPYQQCFAEKQDSIGDVWHSPSVIKLKEECAVRQCAISYTPEPRMRLQVECACLVSNGAIARVAVSEPDPQVIQTIVLVGSAYTDIFVD